MSSEFDYLINEGNAISKDAVNDESIIDEKDKIDPDEDAEKTAVNLLLGVDASIKHFWPYVSIEDSAYNDGVNKLKPVIRKYGGGELPGWMIVLKQYQDEMLLGAYAAGFVVEVRKQIKAEELRLEEEKTKQPESETHAD